jgi:Uma2 family endonuclease
MVANIAERVGMSLDEFLHRQEEQPFELIEGEIIPLMTPKAFGSDHFAWLLHMALLDYGGNGRNGFAYVETTFVLPDTPDSNWVKGSRQPDCILPKNG